MKKIAIAGVLLFVPLLFTGCGTATPLTFQTNWCYNTERGSIISGTYEKLEYEVKTGRSDPRDGFSVQYTNGVYTTELSTVSENGYEVYLLKSDLKIDVQFFLNGSASEVMTDTVSSSVTFWTVDKRLRPISSTKTVHCHTPVEIPASVDSSYTEYNYTYELRYNEGPTEVTAVLTDESGSTERVREIDADDGTYLDNEQILFALRGLDLASVPTFQTYNTTMGRVMDVSLRTAMSEVVMDDVSFERNGETYAPEQFAACQISLGYGDNLGEGFDLVYAKKTSDKQNENRNVLLSMTTPVIRSLGTLQYTLKKATFADV